MLPSKIIELNHFSLFVIQPDAVFLELDLKRLTRAFPGGRIKPNVFIAYRDRGGRLVLSKTIDMKRNMNPFYLLSRVFNTITDLFDAIGSSFRNIYDVLEKEGLTPGEEVSYETPIFSSRGEQSNLIVFIIYSSLVQCQRVTKLEQLLFLVTKISILH